MLSLQSQQEAIERSFGANGAVEIVDTFEESKSAKTPGRPIFAQMLARIEAGDADGIVSWAPDRLARNSIDGGRIIYMLDTGALRDLKFSTYTFENNSQGKFMLSIMFGQSKYYSDALSENIKRGNRTKLERGWRPNGPPLGYLNDPVTRTIIPDPVHFPLVRQMFEMLLTGSHSPRQIALVARDEWGFRTPLRKRSGGKALALSTVYKMFGNSFYSGLIPWNGEIFPGAHIPIVTPEEFSQAQHLLKRQGQARPQKHTFAFTGLMRCGSCGMMVTAENKTNVYGRRYTYYHCTRRNLLARCQEPSVSEAEMIRAFAGFLISLHLPPEVEEWVSKRLSSESGQAKTIEQSVLASRKAIEAKLMMQLKELTSLRLNQLLGDEEFVQERERILSEQVALNVSRPRKAIDRFELFEYVTSFSKYAVDWFLNGDPATQRFIVRMVGSNFSLKGKKLSVQAVKPFRVNSKTANFLTVWSAVEDIRTLYDDDGDEWLAGIDDCLAEPETSILLQNLKLIHRQVGAQMAAPAKGPQSSVGKARATRSRSSAPARGRSSPARPPRKFGQTDQGQRRKEA